MYTMLTGKMPFYADNEQDLFYAVVNSKVRIPFWLLKDTASILRAVSGPSHHIFVIYTHNTN